MILIDAHIHFHGCFDKTAFLNSAQANFKKTAELKRIDNFQSVLCFTESHGVSIFNELYQAAKENSKIGAWLVSFTENENTIQLINNEFKLLIIAGRQIVTKEKLEVLAIGLKTDYEDGATTSETIKFVVDNNSIPIIPWGAGKWLSTRKGILENLVLQNNSYPIYLGDNGNRPFFWKKSKLFSIAEEKGILNLPGSDPLPFITEVEKPGSFGFIIDEVLNEDKPFDSLSNFILSSDKQFETFGKLESTVSFVKNQFAMQIVKRNR